MGPLERFWYRLRVWVIRDLNKIPRRRRLIAQIASREWEMQNVIDTVVAPHSRYEPGAWWRLRSSPPVTNEEAVTR